MTATKPTQRMPETPNPGTIGLFLDVDGTLLDIAPRPEAVTVTADLLRDLYRVLQPRLANAPRKGRRRRILATVLLLGDDATVPHDAPGIQAAKEGPRPATRAPR